MCCYGYFLDYVFVYYVFVRIMNLGVKVIVFDIKKNYLLINVLFYLESR